MDKDFLRDALNSEINKTTSVDPKKRHSLNVPKAMSNYARSHGAQEEKENAQQEINCPACHAKMHLQTNHKNLNLFWRCSNYACNQTQDFDGGWFFIGLLPIELEEFSLEIPTQIQSSRRQRSPQCPRCRGGMQLRSRKDSKSEFWGCFNYPTCKGTVDAQLYLDQESAINNSQLKSDPPPSKDALMSLMELAVGVLGSKHAVDRWFGTPKTYALKGKRPIDVVVTAEGREKIKAMLEEILSDNIRSEGI